MKLKAPASMQHFAIDSKITLGGKTFTITEIDERGKLHMARGARGGGYFIQAYYSHKDTATFYYLTSLTNPSPLRAKNGETIQAYILGDIITDATA